MRILFVLSCLCTGLLSGFAAAAPLTNDKTKNVTAWWITAKSARCDKVCQRQGAETENMLVYSSDGGDIYL